MPAAPASPSGAERRPGRAFSALRYPDFRRFWTAALISNTGTWVQAITVPFVLYALTRRGVWVGLASFAQFAPFVIAGPLGGSLADRIPRRTLLLCTHSVTLTTTATLAVAWALGLRSPAAIVALVALGGLSAGLGGPAWQAFVADLVPRSVLLNAVSLNSAQFNASRAFGPALGGLVLATLGPGWAFTINAFSYLAVIVALLIIKTGRTRRGDPADQRPGVLRQFAGSVRYVRTQPGIAACVLTVVGLGLLTSPVASMLVVFAEEVFDVGRARYGFLGAAIGLGAVLATPFVSSRDPERPRGPFIGASLAVNGLAATAFALAPGYWFGLGALLVMGAAYLGVAAGLNTTIQLLVDDSRRGRVISVYLMALTVALPVGALTQGWLVDRIGPRQTVALAGLALVAVAAVLAARGRFRAMDADHDRSADPTSPGANPADMTSATDSASPGASASPGDSESADDSAGADDVAPILDAAPAGEPAPLPQSVQPVTAAPDRRAASQPSSSGHQRHAGPGR